MPSLRTQKVYIYSLPSPIFADWTAALILFANLSNLPLSFYFWPKFKPAHQIRLTFNFTTRPFIFLYPKFLRGRCSVWYGQIEPVIEENLVERRSQSRTRAYVGEQYASSSLTYFSGGVTVYQRSSTLHGTWCLLCKDLVSTLFSSGKTTLDKTRLCLPFSNKPT